jgi:hypothetical protein
MLIVMIRDSSSLRPARVGAAQRCHTRASDAHYPHQLTPRQPGTIKPNLTLFSAINAH